jgi:aurora kinase
MTYQGPTGLICFQLLVLDPEKRIPLEEVENHPWIVKHCSKGGERATKRSEGSGKSRSSDKEQS